MKKSSYLLVLSTAPNLREARLIASAVLKHKAAACINITQKIESHYRWKGKRERGTEVLLFFKTRKPAYRKLEKLIKKYHSYNLPEIIAVPLANGSDDYLDWVRQSML